MTKAVVEYLVLDDGFMRGGPFLISRQVGDRVNVDVQADATESTQITVPDQKIANTPDVSVPYFARVSAIGGHVAVAWGADPEASDTVGILVKENADDLIPVKAGLKLSFVEYDPGTV